MPLPDLVFLGYCAKHSFIMPFAGHAREIASVSDCLSERPKGWVDRWDFNRATCWNTEAAAWASVPAESIDEFHVFAYRLVPLLFDKSGIETPTTNDQLFPQKLPSLPPDLAWPHFHRIGYDVVKQNAAMGILGFGCSPLSCNGMAESIPVNDFCLLDDLESAMAVARRFGVEQPEPGPYIVIEVLARNS